MKRDPQDNARKLYQIAVAQGGYFTAAQARQVGYAYSQQHFHVERGNWLKSSVASTGCAIIYPASVKT